MTVSKNGRFNQRRRTRNDLLTAAGRLLKAGKKPTMENVAEEALVSRATAYRYFPNLEELLVEAPIHENVPNAEEIFNGNVPHDAEERIDFAEAALHDMIYSNEAELRVMIMNSLKVWLNNENHEIPVRQNRRTHLIETALAPVRDKLGKEKFGKLSAALSVFFGPESMIVYRDVYPLDKDRARKVKSWAVRALVRAALDES